MSMSDGGKGSNPRPFTVPRNVFEDNFDAIFGKKENKKDDKVKDNESSDSNTNDRK